MNFEKIKTYFEENIEKETITKLSFDDANNNSLITSNKEKFNFDKVNNQIKTSDALFFEKSNIIFVEFKNGKIGDVDLRLKALESIISMTNFLIEKNLINNFCFPSDVFQFYLVYNSKIIDKKTGRKSTSSTRVVEFGKLERKLKLQYKYILSKYRILNQDQFKKRFNI